MKLRENKVQLVPDTLVVILEERSSVLVWVWKKVEGKESDSVGLSLFEVHFSKRVGWYFYFEFSKIKSDTSEHPNQTLISYSSEFNTPTYLSIEVMIWLLPEFVKCISQVGWLSSSSSWLLHWIFPEITQQCSSEVHQVQVTNFSKLTRLHHNQS